MPNFEIIGWPLGHESSDGGTCAEEVEKWIAYYIGEHAPQLGSEAVITHINSVCTNLKGERQPFVRIWNSTEKDWTALKCIAEALSFHIDVELVPTLRRFIPRKRTDNV